MSHESFVQFYQQVIDLKGDKMQDVTVEKMCNCTENLHHPLTDYNVAYAFITRFYLCYKSKIYIFTVKTSRLIT